VLLLQKILENNGDFNIDYHNTIKFNIDYHNTIKMQSSESMKMTTTLIAYDEIEKAFAKY